MPTISMNIKQCALAVAIVSASQSSLAEDVKTDFYGSVRMGVAIVDAGEASDVTDGANGRDYLSRAGVKISSTVKDNIKAIAGVEYGLRSNSKTNDHTQNGSVTLRQIWVGLKGDFGTVKFGSQTNVWHSFVRGAYFSSAGDSLRQGSIRDDDLLNYYYKSGAFKFGASLQMENQDGDSIDQYQVGAQYKAGPVTMQAAYAQDNRGENTGSLVGARIWLKASDQVTLSAYRHQADEDYDFYTGSSTGNNYLVNDGTKISGLQTCKTEERSSTGLYGRYRVGANQFHTRYAIDSCDVKGDVSSIKVEYVHYLTKKYRLWASYEAFDNDESRAPKTDTGDNFTEYQLGVRFDF